MFRHSCHFQLQMKWHENVKTCFVYWKLSFLYWDIPHAISFAVAFWTVLTYDQLKDISTVLSVRFEVGVSLLLAPAGADKRGPKAPFPLVENAPKESQSKIQQLIVWNVFFLQLLWHKLCVILLKALRAGWWTAWIRSPKRWLMWKWVSVQSIFCTGSV